MSNERFDIDNREILTEAQTKDTKLLYVSTAQYGDDWCSIMHTHAYAELFYVVNGRGQFKIENITVPVSSDDMVIINPNVEHTEAGLNAVPFEYIVLGIEGLEFSMRGDADNRFCVVDFHGEREDILAYLKNILNEVENKATMYTAVCQEYLKILLVRLLRRTALPLGLEPQLGEKTIKTCAAVRRYIDGHFKENISLEQLAKVAHFNKFYMSHSFARQYGTSPINYLIFKRIEESKRLLAETDHSLSQISNLLGFSSPSYFSQSFRRLEGKSPTEFRRAIE